jgi:hypothetical protein
LIECAVRLHLGCPSKLHSQTRHGVRIWGNQWDVERC